MNIHVEIIYLMYSEFEDFVNVYTRFLDNVWVCFFHNSENSGLLSPCLYQGDKKFSRSSSNFGQMKNT